MALDHRIRNVPLKKTWLSWWLIWAALGLCGFGGSWLLRSQGSGSLASGVFLIAGGLFLLWMYWGLWQARELTGMKVLSGYVLSGNAVWFLVYGLLGTSYGGWAIALVGVWTMATIFMVGLWLIYLLLSPGWAITGVARTLVDEAIRMKVALIFIIGMVLLVPILPIMLDHTERLDYRIKFFLNWSLAGTAMMLSLMSVFLACGSICTEIAQKYIFMTMVKPVSRLQYLMGKWLGIALLNLLLITVAGVGIAAFTHILTAQPVAEQSKAYVERQAVAYEVLTAREAASPRPSDKMDFASEVRNRYEKLKRESPQEYGDKLTIAQRRSIENRIVAAWHAIGPGDSQTYVFTGLAEAKEMNQPLQFRFKPKMSKTPPDEMARLALWVNDRPHPAYAGVHYPIVVAEGNFHVISLDSQLIDSDGTLKLRIANINLVDPQATFPATVSFTPGTGLEILYRVGGFEGNLVRSLAMVWVRLSFLAILGIMAGTFLGFPVACLMSMMVYFSAIASGYLAESLRNYAGYSDQGFNAWQKLTTVGGGIFSNLGEGEYWKAMKIVIRLVGEFFLLFVPDFSAYNPTPLLSDGRLVSWQMLGGAALWVGLVSGGACLFIGWLIFRRRELAKVIV